MPALEVFRAGLDGVSGIPAHGTVTFEIPCSPKHSMIPLFQRYTAVPGLLCAGLL